MFVYILLVFITIIILTGHIYLRIKFRRGISLKGREQTILLGIDGGEWNIINPMIKQGKLPNFKMLMDKGAYGDLFPESPFSPPSWTTIATGLSSAKHGIYHFTIHLPGQNERVLTSADMINGANIWELVESEGNRVGVLGWLIPSHYPEILFRPIEKYLMAFSMDMQWLLAKVYLKILQYIKAPYDKYCTILENTMADWHIANTLYLLKRDKPDFFALRLYGSDAFQHLFWKYLHPEYYDVDPSKANKYGPMIENFYKKVDRFLGKLIEEDSRNLIIVSDHGFQGYSRDLMQPFWLIYDFNYNKLLNELGLLHYNNGNGVINWARTQVYSCGDPRAFHEFAINLEGREREGIVSKTDYEVVKRNLKKSLEELRFKDKNERLFNKITLHDGTPYGRYQEFEVLNDKFRLWNNDSFDILIEEPFMCRYQDETLLDREIILGTRRFKLSEFVTPSVWSATHSLKGIFIVKGKGIKQGNNIKGISSMDIAPTILHWMSMPIPSNMEGKVFSQIFSHKFMSQNPIRYYKKGEVLRRDKTQYSKKEEEGIKEKLHNLGYL